MNDYELLGLPNNSSEIEIKKAFIKLAKKYHPDKNNDSNSTDKFIKIQEAYNRLSKKKKFNQNYKNIINDLYKDGFFDRYINLFYNKFIYNHSGQNKVITVYCTLEEIYNGCIKTIKYKRRICVSPVDFVSEEKTIILNIDYNNYNNQKIKYLNCGDGVEYGKPINDLIIIIKEEKHNLFEKIDNNLILNIDLSLKESLLGNFILKIPLLNNEYYNFKMNKIIKPNYQEIIKNKGIKISENNYSDLILKFNIIFPDKLNEEQIIFINNYL